MQRRIIASLLILILFSNLSPVPGQTARPLTQSAAEIEAILNKLPPALRDQGKAVLAQSDEAARANLARDLARNHGVAAMEFLLALMAVDPSIRVRAEIVDRVGRYPDPRVSQALKNQVVVDPEPRIAIRALDQLRAQETRELARLLDQRIEKARTEGDDKAFRLLASEQERWISLVRGTTLPSFMRTPPPLFSLKEADRSVRVLAFGDFGTGSAGQKQTAAAMLGYHRKTAFDFAITLGDNFYGAGMESTVDPRWKTWWDELYDPLGIKFFATLGNHDWGLADSPAAEILYGRQSPSWRMPAPYYTFTAGPVQFFALDTNEVSEAQLLWLKDELAKSQATWKIVYGHHPIYSDGAHGDGQSLIKRLLPVLKGRADVYLTGHEHDLQHLKAEDGVHFFISGGAGAGLREPKPGPRSLFAKAVHGFCVIDADAKEMKFTFVDTSLNRLHEATLTKSGLVAVLKGS